MSYAIAWTSSVSTHIARRIALAVTFLRFVCRHAAAELDLVLRPPAARIPTELPATSQ